MGRRTGNGISQLVVKMEQDVNIWNICQINVFNTKNVRGGLVTFKPGQINFKGNKMKKLVVVLSLSMVMFLTVNGAFAVNKSVISSNVDIVVAQLEGGGDAMTIKSDAFDPYAFIMTEDGMMLVHPSLVGKSLKEVAQPVYNALMAANGEGIWLEYEWKGKMKTTYAKRTKDNLIVASGY